VWGWGGGVWEVRGRRLGMGWGQGRGGEEGVRCGGERGELTAGGSGGWRGVEGGWGWGGVDFRETKHKNSTWEQGKNKKKGPLPKGVVLAQNRMGKKNTGKEKKRLGRADADFAYTEITNKSHGTGRGKGGERGSKPRSLTKTKGQSRPIRGAPRLKHFVDLRLRPEISGIQKMIGYVKRCSSGTEFWAGLSSGRER